MGALSIGLTAYHAVGNLVFVKVPSERGRYMLTDMCVIVVDCPLCEAVMGEPCRGGKFGMRFGQRVHGLPPTSHGVNVHCCRKEAADKKLGRGWKRRVAEKYKLRLAAGDVVAALTDADELDLPEPIDFDVPVTPKKEPAR